MTKMPGGTPDPTQAFQGLQFLGQLLEKCSGPTKQEFAMADQALAAAAQFVQAVITPPAPPDAGTPPPPPEDESLAVLDKGAPNGSKPPRAPRARKATTAKG